MDVTREENRKQRQENSQPTGVDETTMETATRTEDSATAVVVGGAVKVAGAPKSATSAITTKHFSSGAPGRSGHKRSANILATKQRKKAAHRRRLRASHTKG